MNCSICKNLIMDDTGKVVKSGFTYIKNTYSETPLDIYLCYPECTTKIVPKPKPEYSAYMLYSIKKHNDIMEQQEFQNMPYSEISQKIWNSWKELPDSEKEIYNELHLTEKHKRDEEIIKFKKQFQ